jgi:hypothetical protein
MFNRINVILCFSLLLTFETIFSQDNFQIFIPKYISTSSGFELSFITSNKFPEADKLNIYFLPEMTLAINKIELWVENEKKHLPIVNEIVPGYAEQFKKTTVDFSDTNIFKGETFFQLVLYLKSGQTNSNSLKFFGAFENKDQLIENLINSDLTTDIGRSDIFNVNINYFEKSSTAGNAISFEADSYLNISKLFNFNDVLDVEFWAKIKNFSSEFFRIIDGETNWVEYSLSVNENQILLINSKYEKFIYIKPYFISNNVWYHFHLSLDRVNNKLKVYINGDNIAQTQTRNNLNTDNLLFHFQNVQHHGEIILDQFRLVDGSGLSSGVMKNRNYPDFHDDSTKVIFQMDFSETELNDLRTDKSISYEMIKVIKSDAPLFPRGPEMDIRLMKNYYEIQWRGGNYKDVDYYILEKAVGGGNFIESGKTEAINDEEKFYSLLSEHNDQTEIIYFRIKQVNKDGSAVYSEVMKVGQGLVDDLIIDQNYPNPFNPTTTIEFDLLRDSDVEVKIYDLAGKEVAVLHSGFLSSGSYKFKFDATGFTSGIYLYQVNTSMSSLTRKMILAK